MCREQHLVLLPVRSLPHCVLETWLYCLKATACVEMGSSGRSWMFLRFVCLCMLVFFPLSLINKREMKWKVVVTLWLPASIWSMDYMTSLSYNFCVWISVQLLDRYLLAIMMPYCFLCRFIGFCYKTWLTSFWDCTSSMQQSWWKRKDFGLIFPKWLFLYFYQL